MEGGVSGFPGMLVLNSQNYSDSKMKMKDLLIVRDLYEPIDRKEIPTDVLKSECKILNRKTVATIRQCVDVSVYNTWLMTQTPMTCGTKCLACTKGKMPSTKPL